MATRMGRAKAEGSKAAGAPNRLLAERGIGIDAAARGPGGARPARSVTVNLGESPLGWLMARGRISARQFEAGEQLRRDWTIAGLGPRVTMQWDGAPQSGTRRGPPRGTDPTTAQIAAKQRFADAVEAVGGGLSDILWRVVCAGEGMEQAEKALGWPVRAGKLVLGLALDRLADHYRIK